MTSARTSQSLGCSEARVIQALGLCQRFWSHSISRCLKATLQTRREQHSPSSVSRKTILSVEVLIITRMAHLLNAVVIGQLLFLKSKARASAQLSSSMMKCQGSKDSRVLTQWCQNANERSQTHQRHSSLALTHPLSKVRKKRSDSRCGIWSVDSDERLLKDVALGS